MIPITHPSASLRAGSFREVREKDGHPALNPAVDAGFRLFFGVARAVSLPTGAAWRRGVCRFRGSACRGAPGLALRRQGHRGAPSVLDFFSGVRWSPSLNDALGGFRGWVSYAARLSWVNPFSRRTSVTNLFLTRLACSPRADRSSARIVCNSPALRVTTACWQSSRILSSSRLVGMPAPQGNSMHGSAVCAIPHILYFRGKKSGVSGGGRR